MIESVLLLSSGFYSSLWNRLFKRFGLYLSIIIFFSILFVKDNILNLPFSAISHFYIEKKFGYNKMTFKLFISDNIKSTII